MTRFKTAAAQRKALDDATAAIAAEIAKGEPVPTPAVTPGYLAVPKAVDAALKSDMKNMATLQETYITDNPTKQGIPVTAIKPGGTASVGTGNSFIASPGNVIAVKVYQAGYCISGYNKAASKATSASSSMLYVSEKGGLQTALGAC